MKLKIKSMSAEWKRQVEQELYLYRPRMNAAESLQLRLNMLRAKREGVSGIETDRTPVLGGADQQAALAASLDLEDSLRRQLETLELWLRFMDNALAVLNEEERRLIQYYYLERQGTMLDLSYELGVDSSTIYRWKASALYRIAMVLGIGLGSR